MSREMLEQLSIPVVNDRHYWFLRTSGGRHYQDFVMNNYIAISWDYISIAFYLNNTEEVVKKLIENNIVLSEGDGEDQEDELDGSEVSKNNGSRKREVTLAYNKLHRFINEMQSGDIVLIPSQNSDTISIGVIESPAYEDTTYVQNYYAEDPNSELNLCPFNKRRRVNWLKHIPKTELDVFLSHAISSQHSLSSLDDFADLINRSIYPIYAAGDNLHTTIHAGHPTGLSFADLKELVNSMDDGLAMMAEATGIEYTPSEMGVKIMIHSPGLLEVCAAIATSGTLLTTLIYALNHYRHGGKSKVDFSLKIGGQEISFHSESESKGTLDYKEDAKRLELQKLDKLIELQDKLDIKYPELCDSEEQTLSLEAESSVEE